jgi:hypothetical protein
MVMTRTSTMDSLDDLMGRRDKSSLVDERVGGMRMMCRSGRAEQELVRKTG